MHSFLGNGETEDVSCKPRDMCSDTLAVCECVQIVLSVFALASPGNREKL